MYIKHEYYKKRKIKNQKMYKKTFQSDTIQLTPYFLPKKIFKMVQTQETKTRDIPRNITGLGPPSSGEYHGFKTRV